MALLPDGAPGHTEAARAAWMRDTARGSVNSAQPALEETHLADEQPEDVFLETPTLDGEHRVSAGAYSPSDAWRAISDMWTTSVRYIRQPSNARYVAVLTFSLIALIMSLVDFGLFTGALRIPTPGLQNQAITHLSDKSTYAFEFDTDGWRARGAATSAVWNNIHTFAGQGALEVQAQGLSQKHNGFVFITAPATARPGSTIIAHIYAPTGTPSLVVTLYALDGSWAWSAGAYPSVNPGSWIAVKYKIPSTLRGPIREMGVMLIGSSNATPYTGVLYLDSISVLN